MVPMADSGLTTPVLLVAMPQVLDPFFNRSVVLLIHHEDEGSFGFIINRTTGIRLTETDAVCPGTKGPWATARPLTLLPRGGDGTPIAAARAVLLLPGPNAGGTLTSARVQIATAATVPLLLTNTR